MYRPSPLCDRARLATRSPNFEVRFGTNNFSAHQARPQINAVDHVNLPATAGVLADQRGFSTFSAVALASGVSLAVLANVLLFKKYVITPEVLSNLQGNDNWIYPYALPVGEGIVEGLVLGGLIIAAATVISRMKSPDIPVDIESQKSGKPKTDAEDELPKASLEQPKDAKDGIVEIQSGDLNEVIKSNTTGGLFLGRYRIEKKLGEGGFAVVVLATDTKLKNKKVAIKIVKEASEENLSRFIDEAAIMMDLRHDNLIGFLGYEEKEGFSCIIMEYVNGVTLQDVIRKPKKPVAEKKALEIVLHVAEGLRYAYNYKDLKLLHRDINPRNIMVLNEAPWVKVLDFGLAKGTGTGDHTRVGMLAGTPKYTAPERVKMMMEINDSVDHRSDMYSLICVLFYLLTCRAPYNEGDDRSILRNQVTADIPDVRALNPEVRPEVAEFIDRCLHKDPNDRPTTWEEFIDTLRGLLAEK